MLPLASSNKYALYVVAATAIVSFAFIFFYTLSSDLPASFPALGSLYQPSSQPECGAHCPSDPFVLPGKLHLGQRANETRWIPFDHVALEDELGAPPMRLEDAYASPSRAVAAPAESLTQQIVDEDGNVEWARDKLVLIAGDSHDRNNVQFFCSNVMGSYFDWGGHVGGICRVPPLNLTIAIWFLYGMIDDETSDWYERYEDRPITFERRIDDVMLPAMAAGGLGGSTPDLVIVSSLFWDEKVFFLYRQQIGLDGFATEGYTDEELRWHRSRAHGFVAKIHRIYGPDLALMYRTRHFRKSTEYGRQLRIFQLDQNWRSLARMLGIKLFKWGDNLEGYAEYYDNDQHYVNGPAPWLFSDMMLFYLQRAALPACWGCEH